MSTGVRVERPALTIGGDRWLSAFSFAFEMTDRFAADAVRERCVGLAKAHVRRRDLLLVAGSAGVFVLAVVRSGHWLWWLAAFPPAVYGVLLLAWLLCWGWLPRRAAARLSRLPHRCVTVEIGEAGFAFATAVERLALAWSELQALQRLPSFWLFRTKGGAEIPVPLDALSPEHLAFIRARMAGAAGAGGS